MRPPAPGCAPISTRKLRERGWAATGEPPVDALVERMAALGYVDDRAFASARAAALGRRGYGARRVAAALRAAGIGEEDARRGARGRAASAPGRPPCASPSGARIGPFAAAEPDRAAREKALAAMLRAGHPLDLARRLVAARPGEIPDADSD